MIGSSSVSSSADRLRSQSISSRDVLFTTRWNSSHRAGSTSTRCAIVITPLAAVALGAAGLGLAGTASAFPNTGTAADLVDSLKGEGYNVQINGLVQVPLKLCTATDVHPSLDESDTLQEKQHTQVFVDVSCPSHD